MENFTILIKNINITSDIEIESKDYNDIEDVLDCLNLIILQTKSLAEDKNSDFYGLRITKEEITIDELNDIIANRDKEIEIARSGFDYVVSFQIKK